MNLFIPAPAAVSDALYSLSCPPAARSVKYATGFLFLRREALDKSWRQEVNTELPITVQPQADAAAIVEKLQPHEDLDVLPAGTLAALSDRVEELRGKEMVVYDEFPVLFKQPPHENLDGQARTAEEMAGQFAQTGGMM